MVTIYSAWPSSRALYLLYSLQHRRPQDGYERTVNSQLSAGEKNIFGRKIKLGNEHMGSPATGGRQPVQLTEAASQPARGRQPVRQQREGGREPVSQSSHHHTGSHSLIYHPEKISSPDRKNSKLRVSLLKSCKIMRFAQENLNFM